MVAVNFTNSGDLVWQTNPDGSQSIYNLGDNSYVLSAVGNVFLMACGVGFFYSGLLRRKNALSALYATMASMAMVVVQWYIWGFSLAFSDTGSFFIGNLRYAALRKIGLQPSPEATQIPMSLYCLYELMFAAVTAAIAVGAIAERGRLGPVLIFIFIWSTVVYDPIAYWTWNSTGWAKKLKVLDFAGGIAVHICSGSSALAISVYLGPRHQYNPNRQWPVNNIFSVVLGTVMMWYGWYGFNGGSALSANFVAVQACLNTTIAAATGGLTGVAMDYHYQKKWSPISFCSGVVAGLIAITPGSGYVDLSAALLYGVLGAASCNLATRLKSLGYDDSLDIFATHGIGGLVGSILTGVFAQASVNSLSGTTTPIRGGGIDGNWLQLVWQLAASFAAMFWAFIWTASPFPVWIILKLMSLSPYTKVRASREAQGRGIDPAELGDELYNMQDFPSSLSVERQIVDTVTKMLEEFLEKHTEAGVDDNAPAETAASHPPPQQQHLYQGYQPQFQA